MFTSLKELRNKFLLFSSLLIVSASVFFGFANAAFAVDVPAGPIWNNDDAKVKCPAVCIAAGGTWDGNWHTTIEGRASVCNCN